MGIAQFRYALDVEHLPHQDGRVSAAWLAWATQAVPGGSTPPLLATITYAEDRLYTLALSSTLKVKTDGGSVFPGSLSSAEWDQVLTQFPDRIIGATRANWWTTICYPNGSLGPYRLDAAHPLDSISLHPAEEVQRLARILGTSFLRLKPLDRRIPGANLHAEFALSLLSKPGSNSADAELAW